MPDIVKHLETGTCAVALGVLCGVKTQVRWRWLLGLRSSQGSHFTEQQGKSQGCSASWISRSIREVLATWCPLPGAGVTIQQSTKK